MPRKQVMVPCPFPGCNLLMPEGSRGCRIHRGKIPHKCIEEKCDTQVFGKSKRCTPCRVKHEKALKREANRSYKKRMRALDAEGLPVKPKPRQYADPDDCDIDPQRLRELRQIDMALIDRRDNLNQTLLAARMLRGAVCNCVGG